MLKVSVDETISSVGNESIFPYLRNPPWVSGIS